MFVHPNSEWGQTLECLGQILRSDIYSAFGFNSILIDFGASLGIHLRSAVGALKNHGIVSNVVFSTDRTIELLFHLWKLPRVVRAACLRRLGLHSKVAFIASIRNSKLLYDDLFQKAAQHRASLRTPDSSGEREQVAGVERRIRDRQ
jgi:hypothetical protein